MNNFIYPFAAQVPILLCGLSGPALRKLSSLVDIGAQLSVIVNYSYTVVSLVEYLAHVNLDLK